MRNVVAILLAMKNFHPLASAWEPVTTLAVTFVLTVIFRVWSLPNVSSFKVVIFAFLVPAGIFGLLKYSKLNDREFVRRGGIIDRSPPSR